MSEQAPNIAEKLRNAPEIREFCERWKVGSALDSDFGPDSEAQRSKTSAQFRRMSWRTKR